MYYSVTLGIFIDIFHSFHESMTVAIELFGSMFSWSRLGLLDIDTTSGWLPVCDVLIFVSVLC